MDIGEESKASSITKGQNTEIEEVESKECTEEAPMPNHREDQDKELNISEAERRKALDELYQNITSQDDNTKLQKVLLSMQSMIAVTPLGNKRPSPPMKPLVLIDSTTKLPLVAVTKPRQMCLGSHPKTDNLFVDADKEKHETSLATVVDLKSGPVPASSALPLAAKPTPKADGCKPNVNAGVLDKLSVSRHEPPAPSKLFDGIAAVQNCMNPNLSSASVGGLQLYVNGPASVLRRQLTLSDKAGRYTTDDESRGFVAGSLNMGMRSGASDTAGLYPVDGAVRAHFSEPVCSVMHNSGTRGGTDPIGSPDTNTNGDVNQPNGDVSLHFEDSEPSLSENMEDDTAERSANAEVVRTAAAGPRHPVAEAMMIAPAVHPNSPRASDKVIMDKAVKRAAIRNLDAPVPPLPYKNRKKRSGSSGN